MKEKVTTGGWVWYVREVKKEISEELTSDDISVLMNKCYLDNKTPKEAVLILKQHMK